MLYFCITILSVFCDSQAEERFAQDVEYSITWQKSIRRWKASQERVNSGCEQQGSRVTCVWKGCRPSLPACKHVQFDCQSVCVHHIYHCSTPGVGICVCVWERAREPVVCSRSPALSDRRITVATPWPVWALNILTRVCLWGGFCQCCLKSFTQSQAYTHTHKTFQVEPTYTNTPSRQAQTDM